MEERSHNHSGEKIMFLGLSLKGLINIQCGNHSTHFVKYSKKLPENLSCNYSLVVEDMTISLEGLK